MENLILGKQILKIMGYKIFKGTNREPKHSDFFCNRILDLLDQGCKIGGFIKLLLKFLAFLEFVVFVVLPFSYHASGR